MGRKNCGCNSSETPSHDGFLIKSSGTSAARCGEGQTLGEDNQNCTREDATYDITLNAYTIPGPGQNAPITVCDGSLYTPGQWIQFLFNENILQIQTVNGNVITLKNGCPGGAEIPTNDVGDIVPAKNGFIVVNAPACMTDAEIAADFQNKLALQTKLCVPLLEKELSDTPVMEIVGWKLSDSGDANFQKCMSRIRGVYKKAKSFFFTEIEQVPNADVLLYRPLMRNKLTGEMREILNVSEDPNLVAGEKYVKMYVAGEERLVGPAYIYAPVANDTLYQNSNIEDPDSWLNVEYAAPIETTLNLSIASINALEILGSKFYAMIQFNIGTRHPSGGSVGGKLEVNGAIITMVGSSGAFAMNSVCIPVEVDKTLKTVSVKFISFNTGSGFKPRAHLSAVLRGVQI